MVKGESATASGGKSNKTLWIVLGVVGGVLFLACLGCGGFLLLTPWWGGKSTFQKIIDDQEINRAKLDIRNIEAAVRVFNVKNRFYPQTLEELTKPQSDGTPPLIQKSALIDPWQQQYVYEPDNLHPITDIPLIYSKGGSNRRIANWDSQK
jgi:hypothetical protein